MARNEISAEAIERLERLTALRERGALTDAEFDEQKAKILSGQPAVDAPGGEIDEASSSRSTLYRQRATSPSHRRFAFRLGIFLVALLTAATWLFVSQDSGTPKRAPQSEVQVARKSQGEAQLKQSAQTVAAPVVDTAAEMRASGWDETEPDGDGCMMERRGERDNGLNYVFIYRGEAKPTYELSFVSGLYKLEDGQSEHPEDAPNRDLAVSIDGRRVPAVLQNHYADIWEVEIPITSTNRKGLAAARVVELQVDSEVIAEEAIRPNATSIATIERCLSL